jgi:hypothetical protein
VKNVAMDGNVAIRPKIESGCILLQYKDLRTTSIARGQPGYFFFYHCAGEYTSFFADLKWSIPIDIDKKETLL